MLVLADRPGVSTYDASWAIIGGVGVNESRRRRDRDCDGCSRNRIWWDCQRVLCAWSGTAAEAQYREDPTMGRTGLVHRDWRAVGLLESTRPSRSLALARSLGRLVVFCFLRGSMVAQSCASRNRNSEFGKQVPNTSSQCDWRRDERQGLITGPKYHIKTDYCVGGMVSLAAVAAAALGATGNCIAGACSACPPNCAPKNLVG